MMKYLLGFVMMAAIFSLVFVSVVSVEQFAYATKTTAAIAGIGLALLCVIIWGYIEYKKSQPVAPSLNLK